jgi:cell division protein FtsL
VQVHERVLTADRYWRAVITALAIVVAIVLMFSTWRILETSRWLQDHRAYIRERDSRWEPFMQSIEAHLTRQDADYDRIRLHMEKHEKMMMQSR